jgi:hypothetical protein
MITPLVTDWHYSAMIHEHLGITNNEVQVKDHKYSLLDSDTFFQDNKYNSWPTVVSNTQLLLQKVKEMSNTKLVTNIQDIQTVMTKIPELLQKKELVSKHLDICTELLSIINKKQLPRLDQLEQNLTHENLESLLADPSVDEYDKARLLTIYGFCNEIDSLIDKIESPIYQTIIKTLLRYKTADIILPTADKLFTWLSSVTTVIDNIMNVPNHITKKKYKPVLYYILEDLVAGKLSVDQYYYCQTSYTFERPKKIIIYFTGGITYVEAQIADELANRYGLSVLMGGDRMLNSREFMQEYGGAGSSILI